MKKIITSFLIILVAVIVQAGGFVIPVDNVWTGSSVLVTSERSLKTYDNPQGTLDSIYIDGITSGFDFDLDIYVTNAYTSIPKYTLYTDDDITSDKRIWPRHYIQSIGDDATNIVTQYYVEPFKFNRASGDKILVHAYDMKTNETYNIRLIFRTVDE